MIRRFLENFALCALVALCSIPFGIVAYIEHCRTPENP